GEKLGAEVVLTRSADATLPLAARTARANAEGADLFVSIHANASPRPRLHGVETYYLNNTHDRGTIRLAAMENGLSLPVPARGGADLRYIVSDLVQAAKMEESIDLATAVQRGLGDHLGARYGGVTAPGGTRGPLYGLVGRSVQCVTGGDVSAAPRSTVAQGASTFAAPASPAAARLAHDPPTPHARFRFRPETRVSGRLLLEPRAQAGYRRPR